MKKSIIALATVAAMAAQADNTTLYGRVAMAYTYDDGGKANSTSVFGNSGSRFGIKGEADMGGGLTSFYKYENRIGANLATNKLYVGVKGGFGELSFGKQNLPVDSLGNYSDPFNALTPGSRDGYAKTGSDSSAVYWSPDMSGFKFGVGVEADGSGGTHNHIDDINVAAKYEANGFFAGLGYSTTNGLAEERDTITLGLGYGNDQFEIGLLADQYEKMNDDYTWARLSGTYKITPADSVYLGASSTFTDAKGVKDDWAAAIGYQHKFGERTRVWAEYSFQDSSVSDVNKLSLGLRTDF